MTLQFWQQVTQISMLMSRCSFPYLILSSIVVISFYILSRLNIFISLINDSFAITLSFLWLSISAIKSKRNHTFFIWIFFFSIFFVNNIHIIWVFSKSLIIIQLTHFFRLLVKNWCFASYESLAYEEVLLISGCWLIRLNNEIVFPDSQPPVINILYGWSGICGKFGLLSLMFSFVTSSKLIIFCIVFLYCYI